MKKHIFKNCTVPVIWDKKFIEKLESLFTYYRLLGYQVEENRGIPSLILYDEEEVYVSYEVHRDHNDELDWMITFQVEFKHSKRLKKKFRKNKLSIKHTNNYVSKVILIVPIEEEPWSARVVFDANDENMFKKIWELSGC